jgi:hypothetical protein
MSHIPNSAMPHAMPNENATKNKEGRSALFSKRAGKIADTAKAHPKPAVAAGAALVAGALAAAAIPLVRSRSKSVGGKKAKKGDS